MVALCFCVPSFFLLHAVITAERAPLVGVPTEQWRELPRPIGLE